MLRLTEDQQALVDSTRRMVAQDIAPVLATHPIDRPLPKQAMQTIFAVLANFGIAAPRLPEEAGGAGLSMVDYGLIVEQLPPVVALSLLSHEGTVARLHAGASPEIRDTYLTDLIAGRKICCTANTEPSAGSDSRAVRTRVVRNGDHASIHGSKIWITNASIADVFNVSCIDDGLSGDKPQPRRVLVDRAQSPFDVREIPVMGLQQGHLGELHFEDCRVPATHLIGEAGDAAKYLTLGWNVNRPLIGLMTVHLARRAFDLATEHARDRRQFGRTLGATQLVQQDLADIETAIVTSRLLCLNALDAVDHGERANGTSAMAKRYATQACERAILTAMQILGGMGISKELGIDRLWADARMFQVPDGTNGILALIHGREITGTSAFA
ncbi:acyl-CoA dehydrogenase family protein [Pandoraea terrigena]|uniref:Medium-chain specific acyl-CoA dehydrogenase, mitochondrial n=1 Tax=Pandoraea terrigena TaxID=2508292 RepID=A0A5E4WKS5_9BURK|nr:acyl-CoA dehydrogenase family protein [Pandoraea terrigena]VVE25597.1 isovaleryl-CoA dehydrogenase [Pandoraea terrigena]